MLFPSSFRWSRAAGILIFVCGLAFILLHRQPTRSWQAPIVGYKDTLEDGHMSQEGFCLKYPDPQNIAFALKTGATESEARIPTVMETSLRCADNVIIFSDMEETVGGYHIRDSLRKVPEQVVQDNKDFAMYRALRESHKHNGSEATHQLASQIQKENKEAAWTLDKYKQLHILEELYAEFPDKDWYMMMDADTFLIWPNILTWFERLPNPRRNKLYMGSEAAVGKNTFAHGGSGVIISHAAMHNFAVEHAGAAARWDVPMYDECCGDYAIGLEMRRNGIIMKQAWPTTTGESISTTPFGPKHWCQPVATLHHMPTQEMKDVNVMMRSRNDTTVPIIYSELFEYFLRGKIPTEKDAWDNVCLDGTVEAETSAACRQACEDDLECFQYSHHGKECNIGHSIHLGAAKPTEDGEVWKSGWLPERIDAWVNEQGPCKVVFPQTRWL